MDPGLMLAWGAILGRHLARGRTVVVGRDARPSGAVLMQALAAGLRGVGASVIDIGVVPTPTVPHAVRRLRAGAGVQISASHNPEPWNALKIYTRKGRNIDQSTLDRLLAAYQRGVEGLWCSHEGLGGHSVDDQAISAHIRSVMAAVDVAAIRKRAFRVVIDSVNGSGAMMGPELLQALGCQVIPLYDRIADPFPRNPEPTAANVTETGKIVRAVGADVGFVQDPDADRLALIDHRGTYIGEEYTLALCAAARCAAHGPGAVVATNLSTSRMVEDVVERFHGSVVRTPVGEAHILDALTQHGAVLAGEGNGGVVDPRVVQCRDAQIAMALILEYLAGRNGTLMQAVAEIPRYAMHKEKIAWDRQQVADAIPVLRRSAFAHGAECDERDGLKLSWSDRWVHVRASGTEPAARIISEAPDAKAARLLARQLRQALQHT